MMRGKTITVRGVLCAALACVVAVCLAVGLSACGGAGAQDADAVLNAFDEQVATMPKMGDEEIMELVGSRYWGILEESDVEPTKLCSALFSQLKCSDAQVSFDGSGATVTVTATNVDLEKAIAKLKKRCKGELTSTGLIGLLTSEGQKSLAQTLAPAALDILSDENVPTKTCKAKIRMMRDENGDWVFVDKGDAINRLFGKVDWEKLLTSE